MKWLEPQFNLNEIKIEVTHDCSLQCVHCSSISEAKTGRFMDWPSCSRILKDARALGVKEVAFSGGEPLLWEDIIDAVKLAAEFGMEVFLYTTGNAPDAEKLIKDLYSAGLSRIMFSIFGPNSQQHEKITSFKGSYIKTYNVANYSLNIGLDTEFHFVPFSHNYQDLPEIAMRARNSGIKRISVLRLVPQGRGANGDNGQLSHTQNVKLRKIIEELRSKGHDIRLGSPYNFLMLCEEPQCRSGIDRITVGPDLRIFPCDAFKHISPEEIGQPSDFSNLRDHSLKECWEKSYYLSAIRQYLTTDLPNECNECQKLEACRSGCMAQKFYAYGNLLKVPDPMCLLKKVPHEAYQ